MSRDKKNQGGRLRFVLPRCLGEVDLTDSPDPADVRAVLIICDEPFSGTHLDAAMNSGRRDPLP